MKDILTIKIKLAGLLLEMNGLSDKQVREITGLNQREKVRARTRPYDHDWSLSQIERLLGYHKLELKDILC